MVEMGTLKYLTQSDGNDQPGLFLFDGSNWVKVLVEGDTTPIVPITITAAPPITLTWDANTNTLTIGST